MKTFWLKLIEALAPYDACEFHYPARAEWLRGTVIENGGAGYWTIRDETDVEGRKGQVCSVHIEQVRCVGQTEAWPRRSSR